MIGDQLVTDARSVAPHTWVYRLADRSRPALETVLETLSRHPAVMSAEPNLVRRPYRIPDDPHAVLQWTISATGLPRAWDVTTGDPRVVVAVVDTGIRADHVDLAGRLLPGYDFISSPQSAGDEDGRDADPSDEGSVAPDSSSLHGTHVAGVLGANTNNGVGIAGVDWSCRIVPVRALGIHDGTGKDSDIAAAIRWAAGLPVPGAPTNPNPARIMVLAFGGHGASATLTDAVNAALVKGVIVVAAAGNDGADASDVYPAAIPGVVTVGASQRTGQLATYSNFGAVVDIVAPGGSLSQKLHFTHMNREWTAGVVGPSVVDASAAGGPFVLPDTTPPFGYVMFEGTSHAVPMVAGAISLMVAIDPTITRDRALALLRDTADPMVGCKGCGAGLLNTGEAIRRLGKQTTGHDPDRQSDPWQYGEVRGSCAFIGTRGAPGPSFLVVWIALVAILAVRHRL